LAKNNKDTSKEELCTFKNLLILLDCVLYKVEAEVKEKGDD
jgi:hypothetical protein